MMGKKHISVTAYITIFALIFLSGFSIVEAKSKDDKSDKQEKQSIIKIIREAIVEPSPGAEPTPELSPEPTKEAVPEVTEEDDDESDDKEETIVEPEPEIAAPVVLPNIEETEDDDEIVEVTKEEEIKLVEPQQEVPQTIIEKLLGRKRAQKKVKENIKVIAEPVINTPIQSTSTPATSTPQATTTPIAAQTKPEPPKTLAETASVINQQVKSWSGGYRLDPLAWAVNYFAPEDYNRVTDNLSTPLSLGLLALSTTLGISGFIVLQRPKQYRATVPNNTPLQAQGKVAVKFLLWPSIIISILLTLLLNLIL
ncbi:MAG: hypothetical protein M3Q73_03365 [bacterium]|nr:hypothetical protein [bacterium]